MKNGMEINNNSRFSPKIIPFLLVLMHLLVGSSASAATYDVGGGSNDFSSMSKLDASVVLSAGDIVNIYPGTYTDVWAIHATDASETNPVVIQGVDAGGQPITRINGPVIFDYSGLSQVPSNNGKATILISTGNWITVKGFTVKNIPFLDTDYPAMKIKANNVTLRHMYFKDNYFSLGAWPESSKMTVEFSEFDGGQGGLPPYNMHAIYSFSDHVVIRHCYFHDYDSSSGDVIKVRDFVAEILYNFIEMGTAQRAIDADTLERDPGSVSPDVTIKGNVVIKSIPDSGGYTANFVNYDRNGKIVIVNNTFLDKINQVEGAISIRGASSNEISNNVLVTKRVRFIDGGRPSDRIFTGRNNWIITGAVIDSSVNFTGTLQSSDPGFVGSGNYYPAPGSSLIDMGYNLVSTKPVFQYPNLIRNIVGSNIDIGAYEFGSSDTVDLTPPANPTNLRVTSP